MSTAEPTDALLPHLADLLDADAIAPQLAARWRSCQPHVRSVTSCARSDTKYTPNDHCVATYRLTGTALEGGPLQAIAAVTASPSGIDTRWFWEDPELPGIASALDAPRIAARLEPILRREASDVNVGACSPTPLRYKPLRSCVLGYDIDTDRGPRSFVAKLVARHSRELFATLEALHDAMRESESGVRVVQPVAHWPDLDLVLQTAVAGVAGDVMSPAPPEVGGGSRKLAKPAGTARRMGAGIAELHDRSPAPQARRTLDLDADDLLAYVAVVAQLAPQLEGPFRAATAALGAIASKAPEESWAPSHGALRTDQFLDDGRGLVLVDLDGHCLAHPARDLANLLAYLDWRAIRLPGSSEAVARARADFLEGYSSVRRLPSIEWLDRFEAASLLKIAGRRFRSLDVNEWPLVPRLLTSARELIDGSS